MVVPGAASRAKKGRSWAVGPVSLAPAAGAGYTDQRPLSAAAAGPAVAVTPPSKARSVVNTVNTEKAAGAAVTVNRHRAAAVWPIGPTGAVGSAAAALRA